MAISGLVVTLRPDPVAAESALKQLASDARLSIGERFGRRVAIVAETPSADADERLYQELRDTPGVEFIDITYIDLDGCPGGAAPARSAQEESHVHG